MRIGQRRVEAGKDRLWPLADCHFSVFRGDRTSALPPEADIELELAKRAANDPKRTIIDLSVHRHATISSA